MGAEPSKRLEGKVPDGWLPISHAEAIQHISGLNLCALCDNNESKLKKLSNYYNVENIYTDYRHLINDIKPDFLCIATRTEGRTDIIRYACNNGVKIIYFEKPVSRSIADCKDTLNIAAKKNVVLGYGVNRRYHASYRKAKDIIKSGAVGELREILVEHGKGSLYWSHPHSVDLILFFSETTELEYLQGTCSFTNGYTPSNLMKIDNDPLIENAFFSFKNGIKASINQVVGLNTRLTCTKGIVTIYSDGSFIEVHKFKANGYLALPEFINVGITKSATVTAFNELLNTFYLKGNGSIKPSEITTGMIMLNGIVYSSHHGGIRVLPEKVPADMVITGRSGEYYA